MTESDWKRQAHRMQRAGLLWRDRYATLASEVRIALAVLEETPSDTPTRTRAVEALRAAVDER